LSACCSSVGVIWNNRHISSGVNIKNVSLTIKRATQDDFIAELAVFMFLQITLKSINISSILIAAITFARATCQVYRSQRYR